MRRVFSVAVPRWRLLVLLTMVAASAGAAERYARWDWYDVAAVPYLREAGITHIIEDRPVPAEFIRAAESAGIQVVSSESAGFRAAGVQALKDAQ